MMFDTGTPRLFALPPGVDFASQLVAGLQARLADAPAEAMARVELFVNTERMARRLREVFDRGGPGLLPRIRLVTDLASPLTRARLPASVPALRRRLEVLELVGGLIAAQPDLAARSARFDLADSLAALMEEMAAEDVSPDTLVTLDVSDASGHWQRALSFLQIAQRYYKDDGAPDAAAFQRLALQARLADWEANPPDHPVIVAGSTGSRGTTAAFMQAVAHLPQGAVVLPGFDFGMPASVWSAMGQAMRHEDHPQYRFKAVIDALDLAPTDVQHWTEANAPAPARNAVISLALRPAPVTHQWRSEGPKLPDLSTAVQGVTLVEAPSQRDEAQAIALRLRHAAQDGTRAALITPDRMLTRRVAAALHRWGIEPDDSAGEPAQVSPPGRFLRQVATLLHARLSAETLLALLKHPLCHSTNDRGPHLLNTRELELTIRKKGWPYPTADQITAWADARDCGAWGAWVATAFCKDPTRDVQGIGPWCDLHIQRAERIASGPELDGSSKLWEENAGRKLQEVVEDLKSEAAYGGTMTAQDYADLFSALVSRAEVRDRDAGHPDILIWGTLEARVMDADLLILGGLNEGSWPEAPTPDPWLNRQMRAAAGLLLPERRIGLSAHDFQQAAGAPEVWLTRALKNDDAETVPSRWINRLTNLMQGLPDQGGREAFAQMQARGARWLAAAKLVETPIPSPPAARPSPVPPSHARPSQLSVTEIKRLIRDPYAIYARRVLRLSPLNPLMLAPDALLRGILVHDALESFVRRTLDAPEELTPSTFNAVIAETLGDTQRLPFPTNRVLWQASAARVAGWFCQTEADRQKTARPGIFERKGAAELPELGFTLTATADRIDLDANGCAHIFDYKTGAAPTPTQQAAFDKQLLLTAAMVEQGAFDNLDPCKTARAAFISLRASEPKEVPAPLEDIPPQQVWDQFRALITAYSAPDRGFTARRAMLSDKDISDYDHLSRLGEWDVTTLATREDLT